MCKGRECPDTYLPTQKNLHRTSRVSEMKHILKKEAFNNNGKQQPSFEEVDISQRKPLLTQWPAPAPATVHRPDPSSTFPFFTSLPEL